VPRFQIGVHGTANAWRIRKITVLKKNGGFGMEQLWSDMQTEDIEWLSYRDSLSSGTWAGQCTSARTADQVISRAVTYL
jgi:hypothetical protein